MPPGLCGRALGCSVLAELRRYHQVIKGKALITMTLATPMMIAFSVTPRPELPEEGGAGVEEGGLGVELGVMTAVATMLPAASVTATLDSGTPAEAAIFAARALFIDVCVDAESEARSPENVMLTVWPLAVAVTAGAPCKVPSSVNPETLAPLTNP